MGETRYELHPLLRGFAREKWDASTDVAIQHKFVRYFLELFGEYGRTLKGDDSRTNRALLAADLDNFQQAWAWGVTFGSWGALSLGLAGIIGFFVATGTPSEGIRLLEMAREKMPASTPQGEWLVWLAQLHFHAGEQEEALRLGNAGISQLTPQQNQIHALGLWVIANCHRLKNEPNRAQQAIAQALQLAPPPDLLADLYFVRALCHIAKDAWGKAKADYEVALPFAQEADNRFRETMIYIELSVVADNAGDYPAAYQYLTQAEATATPLNTPFLQGRIAQHMGVLALRQNKWREGQPHMEAMLRHYRQAGNRVNVGVGHHGMGAVATAKGDFATALEHYRQAYTIYSAKSAHAFAAAMKGEIGWTLAQMGQDAEARQWLEASLAQTYAYQFGNHLRLAWVACNVGDWGMARQYLEGVAGMINAGNDIEAQCNLGLTWARYWQLQGDLAKAKKAIEPAVDLAKLHQNRLYPACLMRLAYILTDKEAWETAKTHFTKLVAIHKENQQLFLEMEARMGLAGMALVEGDVTTAQQHAELYQAYLASPKPPNGNAGMQSPRRVEATLSQIQNMNILR